MDTCKTRVKLDRKKFQTLVGKYQKKKLNEQKWPAKQAVGA